MSLIRGPCSYLYDFIDCLVAITHLKLVSNSLALPTQSRSAIFGDGHHRASEKGSGAKYRECGSTGGGVNI